MQLGFRPYLDGYCDPSIQLQMHVYRRSEALFDRWERHKDSFTTVEHVRDWQRHLREQALDALGGLPPDGTPLEVEQTGALHGDGFAIEKLIFQSVPGVYVTANLYVPRGLTQPTGAVLFLCGHAELAKSYPEYQAVCQRLARNGLVALAMDPIGQGERKSYLATDGSEQIRWGTTEHSYAGMQCWWLGQSVARYFVHDARRAIDLLCARPEVDPQRIGVTGNSGGGTQSTWLMLLEPRLAAAIPGTFLMQRRVYMWSGQAQDAEQIVPGGTLQGIDHEDFLIAMAPRPVLVVAVDYDFFPIESTVAVVERAKRIYGLFGKEAHIDLARTLSTHAYHPDLARAATTFFARYLGDGRPVDDREPAPLESRELDCTRSGQLLLDRPQARRVFDLNLDEFQALRSRRTDPATQAETAKQWLLGRVHRHRRPVGFYPRWLPGPDAEALHVVHGLWWSEADLLNAGVFVRPAQKEYERLVVALLDGGSPELDVHIDWLRTRLTAGDAVLALDVRGSGTLAPHAVNPAPLDGHYGTIFKLICDLLWLDDSLEAGRVYDILRAVAFIHEDAEVDLRGRPVALFGAGRGVVHAYVAAALEPRIRRVELAGRLPDVDALVSTRLYGLSTEWHCLLPGFGGRFRLDDLRPLFAGREVVSRGEST
jgi:cephalosporin-C deacetylase-like acetyl esterase